MQCILYFYTFYPLIFTIYLLDAEKESKTPGVTSTLFVIPHPLLPYTTFLFHQSTGILLQQRHHFTSE